MGMERVGSWEREIVGRKEGESLDGVGRMGE